MGRSYRETREIAHVFADKKLPLFSAYTSRAFARTAAVRALLQQGAVGEVLARFSRVEAALARASHACIPNLSLCSLIII